MMQQDPLHYLSETKLGELRRDVDRHRERYATGDFADLERDNGWAIEASGVTIEYDLLASLDGAVRTVEGDRAASVALYRALSGHDTRARARGTRLRSPVARPMSRLRPFPIGFPASGEPSLDLQVHRHLSATVLPASVTTMQLSRRWWNMHIGCNSRFRSHPEGALDLILKTADIRSNFVERPMSRRPDHPWQEPSSGPLRRDQWITSTERAFREFMIVLNRDGAWPSFSRRCPTWKWTALWMPARSGRVPAPSGETGWIGHRKNGSPGVSGGCVACSAVEHRPVVEEAGWSANLGGRVCDTVLPRECTDWLHLKTALSDCVNL